MDGIPLNAWYVAALSSEVTDAPFARTVAGHDLVLYRTRDKRPVALRDRCSHHMFPLSLGRLVDDILVCNYHGFSFDCRGNCVAVPGQDRIPAHAEVRSFPLVEQGQWIWVWTGDQTPTSRPPSTPWIDGLGGWEAFSGMATIECRYSLLVDNLLDLSHETYLHGGYIGTPEVASTPITTEIDRERAVVRVSRHMQSADCPPFYQRATGLSSPIDRWQDFEFFAPSYYQLHVRIAPAGSTPREDGSDPEGFHAKILYGLTPSTENTTHDFWAVCRDFSVGDAEASKFMNKMQREVVQQDVDALNVLEDKIARDPDPRETGVAIDRGAFAARRIIRDLAAAERSEQPQALAIDVKIDRRVPVPQP